LGVLLGLGVLVGPILLLDGLVVLLVAFVVLVVGIVVLLVDLAVLLAGLGVFQDSQNPFTKRTVQHGDNYYSTLLLLLLKISPSPPIPLQG
jgi:hypothetical protein